MGKPIACLFMLSIPHFVYRCSWHMHCNFNFIIAKFVLCSSLKKGKRKKNVWKEISPARLKTQKGDLGKRAALSGWASENWKKNNEWLGRKPKCEFLGKMTEKRELNIYALHFVLGAGDIRSGSYKVSIWVCHHWRNKCRIFFHFSCSLGVIRRLKYRKVASLLSILLFVLVVLWCVVLAKWREQVVRIFGLLVNTGY